MVSQGYQLWKSSMLLLEIKRKIAILCLNILIKRCLNVLFNRKSNLQAQD